jgi:hypothetical protein
MDKFKIKRVDIVDLKNNVNEAYLLFIVKGNNLYVEDVGNGERVCLGKFATKFPEDK